MQQLLTLPSAPVPGFGTGKRPGLAERTHVPGPGAYKARPALGAPTACRGASHRRSEQAMHVFRPSDMQRVNNNLLMMLDALVTVATGAMSQTSLLPAHVDAALPQAWHSSKARLSGRMWSMHGMPPTHAWA